MTPVDEKLLKSYHLSVPDDMEIEEYPKDHINVHREEDLYGFFKRRDSLDLSKVDGKIEIVHWKESESESDEENIDEKGDMIETEMKAVRVVRNNGHFVHHFPVDMKISKMTAILCSIYGCTNIVSNEIKNVSTVEFLKDLPDFIRLIPQHLGLGGNGKKGKKMKIRKIIVTQSKKKKAKKIQTKIPTPRVMSRNRGMLKQNVECGVLQAARNPFAVTTAGCRHDDGYSFPTITFKTQGSIAVSNSTNSVGGVVLSPNPFFAVIDMSNWIRVIETVSPYGLYKYNANAYIKAVVNTSQMEDTFGASRLVGCGWLVRNLQPQLNATGRFFFAPIVDVDRTVGPNTVSAITVSSLYDVGSKFVGGINPPSAFGSNILQLPGAFEMSATDLVQEDIFLRSKPTSYESARFKSIKDTQIMNSSNYASQEVATNGTGQANVATFDSLDSSTYGVGFSGWIIYYEGTPTNTPMLDIQYVYHFEGTPASIASEQLNTSFGLTSSGALANNNVTPFSDVMKKVFNMPWMEIISTGSQMFANSHSMLRRIGGF